MPLQDDQITLSVRQSQSIDRWMDWTLLQANVDQFWLLQPPFALGQEWLEDNNNNMHEMMRVLQSLGKVVFCKEHFFGSFSSVRAGRKRKSSTWTKWVFSIVTRKNIWLFDRQICLSSCRPFKLELTCLALALASIELHLDSSACLKSYQMRRDTQPYKGKWKPPVSIVLTLKTLLACWDSGCNISSPIGHLLYYIRTVCQYRVWGGKI